MLQITYCSFIICCVHQKKELLMYQLFSYFCIGGTAALIDFSVFFSLLPYVNNDYRIASVFSFLAGVSTNFTLCNLFLFKRNNISLLGAYGRHILSNFISFLSGLGLLSLLIHSQKFSSFFIPKICVAGTLMFFNYASARWFSFNNPWQKKEHL
jgi:putative flippase GtrA